MIEKNPCNTKALTDVCTDSVLHGFLYFIRIVINEYAKRKEIRF